MVYFFRNLGRSDGRDYPGALSKLNTVKQRTNNCQATHRARWKSRRKPLKSLKTAMEICTSRERDRAFGGGSGSVVRVLEGGRGSPHLETSGAGLGVLKWTSGQKMAPNPLNNLKQRSLLRGRRPAPLTRLSGSVTICRLLAGGERERPRAIFGDVAMPP